MNNNNEDILSGIPFGKWNLSYILIICLLQASSPTQYYSSVFVDMPMDFRCTNYVSYTTKQSEIKFDNNCSVTVRYIEDAEFDEARYRCTTYEFDTSQVSSTFSSEFQLVCDKAWVSSMYTMILPIGSFIGSFFLGAGDKWGRVTVIRISSTIHAAGSLFVGFAKYDYLVIFGRFLIGLTFPLLIGTSKALAMETNSPKNRSTVGFVIMIPFYVFVMVLGVVAYFIREWRILYLVTSIPMFLVPIVAFFVEESPRWLIQKGRVDEAVAVLEKAAKMNNGTINFDSATIGKELSIEANENRLTSSYLFDTITSVRNLMKDLYGTKTMLKFSFVIPTIWFLSSIVYFGVPLNANSFTNNPYIYIIMIGAAVFPAGFIGPLIIKCIGNIRTGISLFVITGSCMLGTLLVTDDIWWMKWILALVSMTCSGAIITLCGLLISELFPTVLRSTGWGMSFSAYYFGFFFSTFINRTRISETWWAFNTMCGICCIVAAILISILPETHGQKLCETTNEVINREKGRQNI